MHLFDSAPLVNWQQLTGMSTFWIDMISIPLVSVIAGVLTNWTGVYMLFTPVRFHGFFVPGLRQVFPLFPRRVQVLPLWAPGGIIGYQGFVPARAEKLAAFAADKAIARIGKIQDFYLEFEPQSIAAHLTEIAGRDVRSLVAGVMAREHPALWADMTPPVRDVLYRRVQAELPAIIDRALAELGENVEQLVDVRLMAVKFLSDNPEILTDMIWHIAAPELKFMVKIGLLGLPFGVIFALVLYFYPAIPVLGSIPGWIVVLVGAGLVGVTVNLIAIKAVFEPAEPQPRYKYPWRQAKLAKRQHQAAADFGAVLAAEVLTIPNIANELLNGPRGDRARSFIANTLEHELVRILGPIKPMLRVTLGAGAFDTLGMTSAQSTIEIMPRVLADEEFNRLQGNKMKRFASQRLRALPPAEFMEMMYSVVEQDAWLLYAHGAALGIAVGAFHLVVFGG